MGVDVLPPRIAAEQAIGLAQRCVKRGTVHDDDVVVFGA
jgi:hypothetical protein